MQEQINNTKIVDNEKFKEATIDEIVNSLKEKNLFDDASDIELLKRIYMNDQRDLKDIVNELQFLTREEITKKVSVLKNTENKISLDNIVEFTKGEAKRKFILIHYPLPDERIKVVENRSNKSSIEIFNELKDDSGFVSIDGLINYMDVFEESVEKEKIEIKMHELTDYDSKIELKDLTEEQIKEYLVVIKSIINELSNGDEKLKQELSQMTIEALVKKLDTEFHKKIFFSPEENIVIISFPEDPSKDQIKTVTKDKDGIYKLESLDSSGYNFDQGENVKEEIDTGISDYKTDEKSETDKLNDEIELQNEEFGENYVKKRKSFWHTNKHKINDKN